MSATIRDVAREAGVSVATVSRVLNGSGPVSDSARSRVERAARSLEYTPHGAARSLSTRRTLNLGVILPDLYGEFYSQVIRGMDSVTRKAGYHLLLSGSHADRTEVSAALRAMRGRVDGLILMSPDITPVELGQVVPATWPAVLVNSGPTNGRFDTLNVDNAGGSTAVVRHLGALGHERIGLIAGEAQNHDAQERREGYGRTLAALGLERRPEWEVEADFTKQGGYAAAQRLAGLAERPTAIFAANDSMAVGALSALQEAGLRVPEDVAVVGFDDVPIARYVTPPLSTVQVDLQGLGRRAVELLLLALQEGAAHEPRHEVVGTSLVVRRSCGAPREGGGEVSRWDGNGVRIFKP
ncbi:MAG TPA: LacI family DNA-binding transcriptional regulator [Longimicrobiales bacterium]|nr:LacI family DNA-binding transcriptional regulator [Longimicrobiales bacterium]